MVTGLEIGTDKRGRLHGPLTRIVGHSQVFQKRAWGRSPRSRLLAKKLPACPSSDSNARLSPVPHLDYRGDLIASDAKRLRFWSRLHRAPTPVQAHCRGRSDVRILHDHARTGVPSQNGSVVSGYRKIHGLLIVIHCLPQRVICRCAGSSAVANAGISETAPR